MKHYFSKKARRYAKKHMREGLNKYDVVYCLAMDLKEPCSRFYENLPQEAKWELDLLEADACAKRLMDVTNHMQKAVHRLAHMEYDIPKIPVEILEDVDCALRAIRDVPLRFPLREDGDPSVEHSALSELPY